MRSLVAVLLILSPALASADPSEGKFNALKESAETFEGSLSSFLERYVGECPDRLEAAECHRIAEAFRQKVGHRRYTFTVGEEQLTQVSPGRLGSNGEFTLNLTPFFPAGNYAVTQGTPHKLNAEGNPVFAYLSMKGKAPDGDATQLMRMVAHRMIRLQVVFTPEGVWALPKRGGGKMMGVKGHLDGVRAVNASTGQALAYYFEH